MSAELSREAAHRRVVQHELREIANHARGREILAALLVIAEAGPYSMWTADAIYNMVCNFTQSSNALRGEDLERLREAVKKAEGSAPAGGAADHGRSRCRICGEREAECVCNPNSEGRAGR